MATVNGFTKERMEAIEAASVVGGAVVGGHLILTRFDESEIDAGSVIGPTGDPGVSEGDLEDQMALNVPIGAIIDYIGSAAPTNYMTMIGQTVINGQTLYPILWSRLQAAMKSGTSIVFPDTRGRLTVMQNTGDASFDVIGEVGGEKTHVLITSEIPSHNHVQNAHSHTQNSHNHTQDGHNHVQTQHYHNITAHTHNGITGNETVGHVHAPAVAGTAFNLVNATESLTNIYAAGTDFAGKPSLQEYLWGSTDYENTTHQHYFVTDPTTATMDNQAPFIAATTATNQATTATNNNTTATNQVAGGDGAHNNLQPYVVFLKIIKVA